MKTNLPNSIEAEKKILSAMLLKEGVIVPDVAEILVAEDFYRQEHRIIYAALLKLYDEGKCDPLSLIDELTRTQYLNKIGHTYVLSLINAEFTTYRAVRYAKMIKEKSQLRQLMEIGEELKDKAEEGLTDVEDLLAQTDDRLQRVMGAKNDPAEELRDILKWGFDEVFARARSDKDLLGLSTGFWHLDKATGGLKKSDLLILAARPSMGKTALALNIAMSAAREKNVLLFSLEMSKSQLFQRIVSSDTQINATRIANGTLNDDELGVILNALDGLAKRQLIIDDTGGLPLSELRMRAKRITHKYDLGLIVIDYIQLMQGSKETWGNRVQEVSEISRGLKALARELDIPVLALSQLNRSVELRAEKKPQLSDLRESGSLEQDADIVMFLYRDEYYNRDDVDNQNVADLIIAKNRNGATGTIKLRFEKEFLLFQNLVRGV